MRPGSTKTARRGGTGSTSPPLSKRPRAVDRLARQHDRRIDADARRPHAPDVSVESGERNKPVQEDVDMQ